MFKNRVFTKIRVLNTSTEFKNSKHTRLSIVDNTYLNFKDMNKNQPQEDQSKKDMAKPTSTDNDKKITPPENDNFISEKDEVKYAEDKLRDQVQKKDK